jgi:DNA-binding SARP family transcriptional activator
LAAVPSDPYEAVSLLQDVTAAMPLDTGYDLDRETLLALSYLMAGDLVSAAEIGESARKFAELKGSRRTSVRLEIVLAMADSDSARLIDAIDRAATVGELALLTMADAVGRYLWLVPNVPPQLLNSIRMWPRRWLPILRRALDEGGTANAATAAALLDEYGELVDVPRLRAFAKTYRRQLRRCGSVGRALARRVAPTLEIRDLGRTHIVVGDRQVPVGRMRRKSAALLLYLASRPGHTATREQVLEELWPESDPDAATNNLNQSLYFLRREIEPWYEDEVSVEYVCLQGDIVWLEPSLTNVASTDFVRAVRSALSGAGSEEGAYELISSYAGQFTPEFEYDEWAMAWRARVHALFLQYATETVLRLVRGGQLQAARDVALTALDQDPTASEIERRLIWIYWTLGSQSAAMTQFEHLVAQERADGLDPSDLGDLTGPSPP